MEILNVYTKAFPFISNRIRASLYLPSDLTTPIQQIIDTTLSHPARTWNFTGLNPVLYSFFLDEINDANIVVTNLASISVSPATVTNVVSTKSCTTTVPSSPNTSIVYKPDTLNVAYSAFGLTPTKANAIFVHNGTTWTLQESDIVLTGYPTKTDLDFLFPFQVAASSGDAYRNAILDMRLDISYNSSLYYSPAIITKNGTNFNIQIFSCATPNWTSGTEVASFTIANADDYDHASDAILYFENSFGAIAVRPSKLTDGTYSPISWDQAGLSAKVFDKAGHLVIDQLRALKLVSTNSSLLSGLQQISDFPFVSSATSKDAYKKFIKDVYINVSKVSGKFYSFAVITKTTSAISLQLYRSDTEAGSGYVSIGTIQGSDAADGYIHNSMTPFKISGTIGWAVIVPGELANGSYTLQSYSIAGLQDGIFNIAGHNTGSIEDLRVTKATIETSGRISNGYLDALMFKATDPEYTANDSLTRPGVAQHCVIQKSGYIKTITLATTVSTNFQGRVKILALPDYSNIQPSSGLGFIVYNQVYTIDYNNVISLPAGTFLKAGTILIAYVIADVAGTVTAASITGAFHAGFTSLIYSDDGINYSFSGSNYYQVPPIIEAYGVDDRKFDLLSAKVSKLTLNPRLNICSKVYVTVGFELSIHLDAIVLCKDAGIKSPEGVSVDIQCDKGKTYERFWTIKPVSGDVGTYTMIAKVYDRNKDLLQTKTISLIITAATALPVVYNVLDLGHSLVEAGVITPRQRTNFEALGSNPPNFRGSFGTAPAKFEGRGGWTLGRYLNSNNDSPLYTSGSINMSAYRTAVGIGSAKFDLVNIFLGINDCWGNLQSEATSQFIVNTQMKALVDIFLNDNASGWVVVHLSTTDGNTRSGWDMGFTSTTMKEIFQQNVWRLREIILDTFDNNKYSSRVFVGQAGFTIDRWYGYDRVMRNVSDFYAGVQEEVHINYVHPYTPGYNQMGNGAFHQTHKLLLG